MDYFRRMWQFAKGGPSNEELGRRSSVYPDDARGEARRSIATDRGEYEEPNEVLETSEKLREFRMLTGITTHPSFKAPRGYSTKVRPVVTTKGRPAPNLGIYPSVVANEFKTKQNFHRFGTLINCCLGLQIVIAAALTALGAGHGPHSAVTAFGAINTIIAGFLTYLKGSGLPMRFRYYAHEWSKVREYIEQRERDLGVAGVDIDVHQEVNIIRAMYEEVKGDIEANTPDRFVSSQGPGALGVRASMMASNNAATRQSQGYPPQKETDYQSESSRGGLVGGLAAGVEKGTGVENRLSNLGAEIAHVKDTLMSKVKDVEALEQGVHSRVTMEGKRVMVLSEKEANTVVSDRAKEAGDLERGMEGSVAASVANARNTVARAFETDPEKSSS